MYPVCAGFFVQIMSKRISEQLNIRVAFVSAEWHKELVDIAVNSCRLELRKIGFEGKNNISQFTVPGSLEIPLAAKRLIQTGKFDAVIGFGLVVDGGIYRHEFVAQAVLDGIMKVALETNTPVLSVVLTPQKFDENNHEDVKFFQEHMIIKGKEAASSLSKIMSELEKINSL